MQKGWNRDSRHHPSTPSTPVPTGSRPRDAWLCLRTETPTPHTRWPTFDSAPAVR